MERTASDEQGRWGAQLLDGLTDCGVRDVIISPGSRSTPLVLAVQANPRLRTHVIVDERSAAFFALGQARLTGKPSMLLCTSGTAPANYYPAVIEAFMAGLPLLVLSADRPSHLQGRGAPQTIDQRDLYGQYAHYFDVPPPTDRADDLEALVQLAARGYALTVAPQPVPVHLNFRADKPLEWRPTGSRPPPRGRAGCAPEIPLASPDLIRVQPGEAAVRETAELLRRSRRPLVLAGACHPWEAPTPAQANAFLHASGAVLCAETTSQLRWGGHPRQLDAFDWLFHYLDDPGFPAPDCVIQLGPAPTSAGLQGLLNQTRAPLVVCARQGTHDPFHGKALSHNADPGLWLEALTTRLIQAPPTAKSDWNELLRRNGEVWPLVDEELERDFGEALALRRVVEALPPKSTLVIGNSLVIRHVDRYVPAGARDVRVLSQRGASGIEGALSATLGAASCCEAPTTLLVGDVSFLHDLGALWGAEAERLGHDRPWPQPIVIAVLNNSGGRIFEHLPVAQAATNLHPWTTSHDLELSPIAGPFGSSSRRLTSEGELQAALTAAYSTPGVHVLDIRVSSHGSAEASRHIEAALQRKAEAWASQS